MEREEENRSKKEYEKPRIVYQQSLEEVAAGCVGTNVKVLAPPFGECTDTQT